MRVRERRLTIFLYLADLAVVLGSFALADLARHRLALGTQLVPGIVFLDSSLYAGLAGLWTLVSWSSRLYDTRRATSWGNGIRSVIIAALLCVVLFGALLFYLKYQSFSRILVVYLCAFSLVLLSAYRLLVYWLWDRLKAAGFGVKRTILVGSGEKANRIAQAIRGQPLSGMRLVGFTDIAPHSGKAVPDIREVTTLVDKMNTDEVVIALPPERRKEIIQLVHALRWSPVRVKLVPDLLEMATIRATAVEVGGLPLIGLREPVMDDLQELVKRMMDIVVSSVALMLFSPLMLVIALLVRLDSPGPAIYRHERIGENGKPFLLLKFRSMVPDADRKLAELIDLDDLAQPAFKIRGDPRVTRVGRVIRRLALDELPQLWNVFKGEMSLVGPRPEITEMVRRYNLYQLKRLSVKPGLTGPMQVSGCGDLQLDERVRLELAYIENYSIWQDIWILLKTPSAIVSGRGIY